MPTDKQGGGLRKFSLTLMTLTMKCNNIAACPDIFQTLGLIKKQMLLVVCASGAGVHV